MAKSDIAFYADEHIPYAVIKALRAQNITITHAGEVGMLTKDDDTEHLPFASSLGAVLVHETSHLLAGHQCIWIMQVWCAGQANKLISAASFRH